MSERVDTTESAAGDGRPVLALRPASRGQSSLPALVVALLMLTAATGISLTMAEAAIEGGQREPTERRVAVSLASALVAPDSPLTTRANVIVESRLDQFDATTLRRTYPVTNETAVSVSVGGEPVAASGDPRRGTSFRRLAVVEERTRAVVEPDLGWQRRVTLPRRGVEARITLQPPAGTTIRTVRANDRIVLHDNGGLNGSYEVALSRRETTTISIDANGPLPRGSVRIAYDAIETRKVTVEVLADA